MSGHPTGKVTREVRNEQKAVLAPWHYRITGGLVGASMLLFPPIIHFPQHASLLRPDRGSLGFPHAEAGNLLALLIKAVPRATLHGC